MESLIVPELILFKFVNGLLIEIDENWNNAGDKTTTHLYRLWNGVEDGRYNYYEEAVNLFATRGKDNPRRITCRLFFDAEKAEVPTIHITMPSDQTGDNDIGIGESGRINEMFVDSVVGAITPTLARRFDTTFYAICTSENNREVLLMYHTLRAMFISGWNALDQAGFQNKRLSGQDLKNYENIVPNHIFMRGIGIQSSFDVRVPGLSIYPIISNLILQGTINDPS